MSKPLHNYRVLYMSDPIYLNESDEIDIYLERKNNTTGAMEPATSLVGLTVSYTATATGSAIAATLSKPLIARANAPGYYYATIPGAAKAANLTVGQQIFAKISDGGIHIDVTRPLVVRQVRDPVATTVPGGGVVTTTTPPPPPPPPPSTEDSTPDSVAIGASTSTILVGATETLTAAIRNAAGATLALSPTSWSSSNDAIATVDGSGVVTGIAVGSASITAHYNDLSSNGSVVSVTVVADQTVTAVTLPRTTLSTDVADTPRSGRTIVCTTAAEFTAALADIQAGDWIKLTAGATFSGNFNITLGGTAGNWVWIDTTGSKPAEFTTFLGDDDKAVYTPPNIQTPNGVAVLTLSGANAKYLRFMGLEFTAPTSNTSCNTLIKLGLGSETNAADLPSHLIFDRCYIHGHDTLEARRGIALNSASTAVIDSSVTNWHSTGFDTQAILGWNGPGPYKIKRNWLEASTEIFAMGGADPQITNQLPEDGEIVNNYFSRPLSKLGDPSWFVKNSIELKIGRYWLIEGNIFVNCWPNGQLGWAFVFWSVNQDATAGWSETSHITVRHNIIYRHAAGIQLSEGYRDGSVRPYVKAHHLAFNNNVFVGLGDASVGDGGYGFLAGGELDSVSFEHNTMFEPASSPVLIWSAGTTMPNHTVRNNLLGTATQYRAVSAQSSFLTLAPGASEFAGNVVQGFDNYAATFPAGSFYPLTAADVGLVGGGTAATSPTAAVSDLALAVTSLYKGAGTDGADPGADIPAVLAATADVPIPS